jgi:hypothetical protein
MVNPGSSQFHAKHSRSELRQLPSMLFLLLYLTQHPGSKFEQKISIKPLRTAYIEFMLSFYIPQEATEINPLKSYPLAEVSLLFLRCWTIPVLHVSPSG